MFFVLGKETWTHILTHHGSWEPVNAVVWCLWTAFATLAGLGIIRPLKMLPIVLLEIFYKVMWLIMVASRSGQRARWRARRRKKFTFTFSWVILPIVAVPWGYVFVNFIYKTKEANIARLRPQNFAVNATNS